MDKTGEMFMTDKMDKAGKMDKTGFFLPNQSNAINR